MSLSLPTPNKTPGDPQHTQDTNLIIEAINTVKSQVDNVPAGPQGPQGEPGTPGQNGAAATVFVAGTVTTEPGANAQVIESGTPQNKALTFYIPRGSQGPAGSPGSQGVQGPAGNQGPAGPSNTLSIGNVITGTPSSQAAATITGTSPNQALNLTIPQGVPGDLSPAGQAAEANAVASAVAAAASEQAALASEQAAALSEAAALVSEQNAASSESAADADRIAAQQAASDADADRIAAAASESAAAGSASAASASAAAALVSEQAAAASAQIAGTTSGVLYEHAQTLTANVTLGNGNNAISAGPIFIDSGVTVTVPIGSTWAVL